MIILHELLLTNQVEGYHQNTHIKSIICHSDISSMGGFICTFSLLISLSLIFQTSKFRNQFIISSKYLIWFVTENERPILVLSLLRCSEMTSELITFNNLRCHTNSTALGTRTGYWKPTRRGTDETPQCTFGEFQKWMPNLS